MTGSGIGEMRERNGRKEQSERKTLKRKQLSIQSVAGRALARQRSKREEGEENERR